MKKEMTLSFAVTLGTLATTNSSYAQEAPKQTLLTNTDPIANETTALQPTPLSTVETAKPTLDRAIAITPTPEFSSPKDEVLTITSTPKTPASTPPTLINSPTLNPPTPEYFTHSSSTLNSSIPKPPTPNSSTPNSQFSISNSQFLAESLPPETRTQLPEPTQLKNLTEKQNKLERELQSIKQELKQQESQRLEQQNNKSQAKPHQDLPDGLQIYGEAIFLKPRSDLMMDFARVDPGNTFLATGGPIAALEYRQSTAWRVNARYRFAKSPWELGASYTRLGSDDTATALKPTNGFLFSTLTAPRGGSASADSAIATAKIDYTVLDLDAGYHIQPSKNVDLKLIAGLRIANVGQNMAAVYTGGSFDPIPGTFVASQQFRGLGPRIGAEGRVALGSGFSVYGRSSGSLLFGDQESDLVETFQGVPVADFKVKRKQTVPVLDAAIGLDWSTKLGKSGKFTVGVGYEYQHWFNLTRNVRYTDASAPGGFVESKGDLSMQGFFAKLGMSWTF